MIVIGRGGEQLAGHSGPVIRRRQCQIFLAFEVMKETALGYSRRRADILNPCRRIPLGADYLQRRLQQLRLGWMRNIGHWLHTH